MMKIMLVDAASVSAPAAARLNSNDNDAIPGSRWWCLFYYTATDHDAAPGDVDADYEDYGHAAVIDNCDDAAVDGDDPRRE